MLLSSWGHVGGEGVKELFLSSVEFRDRILEFRVNFCSIFELNVPDFEYDVKIWIRLLLSMLTDLSQSFGLVKSVHLCTI